MNGVAAGHAVVVRATVASGWQAGGCDASDPWLRTRRTVVCAHLVGEADRRVGGAVLSGEDVHVEDLRGWAKHKARKSVA